MYGANTRDGTYCICGCVLLVSDLLTYLAETPAHSPDNEVGKIRILEMVRAVTGGTHSKATTIEAAEALTGTST